MKKILAVTLAVIVTLTSFNVSAKADGGGKYVSDVYFAYAKTEEEAVQWLADNGWEPISGSNDFNAGKESSFDSAMAVAMGIKRTDNASEAITDMAVMNMKGGYSFPDYEALVQEKKTQIDEFINSFLPAIREYRANYNGEGSAVGKARADFAYTALNHFIDGDPNERYAANDTGMPLGDLLLQPLRQEGNEAGGDLQQILLESSGAAVLTIETLLGLAADTGNDTWVTRLSELSGDQLLENLEKYVPEAAGQNVSASVADQYLMQYFGDAARILADQWPDIHERLTWYEDYNNQNDLWMKDGETAEAYTERAESHFETLMKDQPETYDEIYQKYYSCYSLYNAMADVNYAGDWGETLCDFFNPGNNADYTGNVEAFLPFAAVLSEGQRASLSFLPLNTLLTAGLSSEEGITKVFNDSVNIWNSTEPLSVYSGINRGIFRGGVALTNEALMEKNQGHDPFADIIELRGVVNITCTAAVIVGLTAMCIGGTLLITASTHVAPEVQAGIAHYSFVIDDYLESLSVLSEESQADIIQSLNEAENALARYENQASQTISGVQSVGKIFTGIGGALLLGVACVKAYQLYEYYNVDFTAIPLMIVDEADIVSYTTDENGNELKNINFNQFAYYQAAQCNRQAVGQLSDWQSGVEKYAEWGCGDVADLNGDFGQEWLALYTVKNTAKGNPILADSLKLQYGNKEMPKGCTVGLHFFTMTNAVDLGDEAYSYNNDKHGVYFFWDSDANAVPADAGATASAFSVGHLALAGACGLVLGLLIAYLISLSKKKKKAAQGA